jgi:hypothetical protein
LYDIDLTQESGVFRTVAEDISSPDYSEVEKGRSAPFDPRYYSTAGEVYLLAQDLAAEIETKSGLYTKRLSGPSRVKRVECLECLIVNFLRLHLTDPGRYLAVPLGKQDYDGVPCCTYRSISETVKGLELLGYVRRIKGFWDKKQKRGEVTRFQMLLPLLDQFDFYSLDPTMIQMRERQPLVELRPSKQTRAALLRAGKTCPDRLPWPKEYRADKARMEASLRKINSALAQQFTGLRAKDSDLAHELSEHKHPVNLFQRDLHRVFTTDPRKGGRFAGAWWLTLPSELRKHIRMSAPGKPPDRTTELDYEALHFRMMYAVEGVTCVADPYSIYPDEATSAASRKAVKLLSLMMINASTDASAKKAAQRRITQKFRTWWNKNRKSSIPKLKVDDMIALMWPGCPPLATMMTDIQAKHAPIAKHFCTGAGRWLMFKDSEIAERIMLRMIDDHGVVPLCVHDSYIVRHDYEPALRQIMQDEFRAVMGSGINLARKPTAPQAFDVVDDDAFFTYSRMLDAWTAGRVHNN